MHTIEEHSTVIRATLPKRDATKKQEVFFNPTMSSNRNISILLLNSIPNKNMKIALPLAGSGIRGLRFLKELKKGKMDELYVNDKKENFVDVFKENLTLNNIIKTNRTFIHNEEASLFLLHRDGFDYIDIDPFGSPNPFLSAAIARVSRKGIIAITATDTAALTGTYPKVTKRKYWATSFKNHMMHETGLRILIRKVQMHGIQFDKAFTPIISYHKDHYFRVYFRSEKGKEKCDRLIRQHRFLLFCPKCLNYEVSTYNNNNNKKCSCRTTFESAGPLWAGKLLERKLIHKMARKNPFPEEQKFLELLNMESRIDTVGFHDLHAISKKYKTEPPKMSVALERLDGVRTHFSLNGVKCKKSMAEVIAGINISNNINH